MLYKGIQSTQITEQGRGLRMPQKGWCIFLTLNIQGSEKYCMHIVSQYVSFCSVRFKKIVIIVKNELSDTYSIIC